MTELADPTPTANTDQSQLAKREITQSELDEASAAVAQPREARVEVLENLLVFRLHTEKQAISAVNVRRVTRPVPVRAIPHRAKSHLKGLALVDGEEALIFDLSAMLGLVAGAATESPNSERRLVILVQQGQSWGFEVEEILGVIPLTAGQRLAPPATVVGAPNQMSDGLMQLGDGQATILSAERLVTEFLKVVG